EGFSTCGYFQAASRLGQELQDADSKKRKETGTGVSHPTKGDVEIAVTAKGVSRQDWQGRLKEAKALVQ
ncbi:hypothetical protein HDU93_006923, partial [Gonapodya sp. JEL0774]